MTTISLTAEELQGRHLLDQDVKDIGEITDLYVDADGRPHWLLVDTSFFPGFYSVIPVTDVVVTESGGLEVHYTMEKLTGAPNAMKGRDYASHREGRLYDYYGLEAPEAVTDAMHHGAADKVLQPPSALCRFSTLSCENKPIEFDKE
ncbi:MAG TPA: PRC-barrel domain-containing protein [Thermoleophilia bacterium]|nr:PRC-barrel domain-containing protein [Thermoleophilia bacterium]